jgi:hypothetical protein
MDVDAARSMHSAPKVVRVARSMRSDMTVGISVRKQSVTMVVDAARNMRSVRHGLARVARSMRSARRGLVRAVRNTHSVTMVVGAVRNMRSVRRGLVRAVRNMHSALKVVRVVRSNPSVRRGLVRAVRSRREGRLHGNGLAAMPVRRPPVRSSARCSGSRDN